MIEMNLDFIDTSSLYIILGAIVALLGIILAVLGLQSILGKRDRVSDRLDQFVAPEDLPDAEGKSAPIITREMTGSLFSRTLVNWFSKLVKFFGRYTPDKQLVELEHKLTIAGNPGNLHAGGFFTMRILVILAGIAFAVLLNWDIQNLDMTNVLLGAMVILICWLLPTVWLNGRVRTRQDEIRRGLPDALDMLSVCASAGLGFDQSLQKISQYWDTELGTELKRVTEEMEMGISRAEALKNLSNRLEVDELSRFVAILIQAEKIGMSYADVLHSQAEQMRILRQYRAREIANKLPAKMIMPLALFIFPAMIAVILGPAIPTLFGLF